MESWTARVIIPIAFLISRFALALQNRNATQKYLKIRISNKEYRTAEEKSVQSALGYSTFAVRYSADQKHFS
jgi:hypothetical protein